MLFAPPETARMTCLQLATRICVTFNFGNFHKTEGSHVHFFVSGGDVEPSKIRTPRFQKSGRFTWYLWRIIPRSKWQITMVSIHPLRMGLVNSYKWRK